MEKVELRPDCTRCAALCCVVFAFDRRQGFAIDKRNGEPCPHLDGQSACRIYADREEQGFAGCVSYDCYGAGQRVTQDLFGGRSWFDEPALLPDMTRAFIAMRAVHELLFLLEAAGKIDLSVKDRYILRVLTARLAPEQGWPVDRLVAFRDSRLEKCTRKFLSSLRSYYTEKRA